MKKTILLGMIWLAAVACDKKEDAMPQVQSTSSIISSQKETAVRTSGENLKVKLVSVSDSRCPADVVCIVAGNADLTFNISDGTNQTEVRAIYSSFDESISLQEFKLGGQTYSLKVSQVLPYPDTSKTPALEDYEVSVSIEKR